MKEFNLLLSHFLSPLVLLTGQLSVHMIREEKLALLLRLSEKDLKKKFLICEPLYFLSLFAFYASLVLFN